MSDRAVLKWTLPLPDRDGHVAMVLPQGARLLSVGAQGVEIVMWGVASRSGFLTETRHFLVLNTGMSMDVLDYTFLGTVEISGIIWHVFVMGR